MLVFDAEGRTYLGPTVNKETLERSEAVTFGGGGSSTHDGAAHGGAKVYGANERQVNSGKTSGELQIPFDPNAPLTPRLLGRDPSPRLPNRRNVDLDPTRDSIGDSKDENSDLVTVDLATSNALFLGVHGELYDANYEALSRSLRIRGDLDSNPAKYFEQQKNTRTFEVSPFPQPELDHESFFEWEQEVLVWKDRTEKQLRDIRQPTAIGRTFYRPKFGAPSIDRKSSSEMLLSTPPDTLVSPTSSSPDPTSPDGNREKLDVSGAPGAANNKYGSSSSPVRSLPSNGNNGRGRDDEEFDSDIPSWDAVLVPAEPNPVDYLSYEEYKHAMLRWSALVATTSPKIAPSPRQLPTLLQLSNHTLISPNPLAPQEAAALSYYNSYYHQEDGLDDGENDELADDADDDALFDAPNDRYRHSDSVGSNDARDETDDAATRKLRRKTTHESAPGSSPGSPSLGFDKRKSLKISRLPLTLISQNSWWDSDSTPALVSPQDSPSDVYPSPSNSPHSRLHRSNGRTPRSRMARTKFASQNAAPLPSRPGLATMSHPSSSMDTARIATPPGTLEALPSMIPKSARGRESSADNSPFGLRSHSSQSLTSTTPTGSSTPLNDGSVSASSQPSGTPPASAVLPAAISRGSLILNNSRPSSMKVLPIVSPETRKNLEELMSDLIDRQNARYSRFGRFGCDPVRGEGVLGAPSTNPLPEINYKLLVTQSVAAKKLLADEHRTQLWQSHPSRKGDLDVPFMHLSPLGPRGFGASQTSPVQLPVLQSWANTLATRPRESHRSSPQNSLIYQALLEILGITGENYIPGSTTISDPSSAVHTLSLLDVPQFVSLLATEFMATGDRDSDAPKKSPRKIALIHTFATWLFPTARKSKAREMSVSPRGQVISGSALKKESSSLQEKGKDSHAKDLADSTVSSSAKRDHRSNIESAPQSTDTLSATPTRHANIRSTTSHQHSSHTPMYRVRHFQQLLRLSQEIQNPKVLFKLSFLLYLCISHRPKQASEVFAILFEHLAAMAPRPEDEVLLHIGSVSGPGGDGVSLSDDEASGHHVPSHRGRSNSASSNSTMAQSSDLASSTATNTLPIGSSSVGASGVSGSLGGVGGAVGGSSSGSSGDRCRDFHAYASRQSMTDSLESALYSTLFLLNYGRSCPVEYHTWHKSQLPEFPDFKSASMIPNAYQVFSARGGPIASETGGHGPSNTTTPSTPSVSSSATSESFLDGSSLPSSSTGTSSSATHPSGGVQTHPSTQVVSSTPGSESSKYSVSSSSTPSDSSQHSNTAAITWEIKDTATRLALCIDRAHQLQLLAKFVSEALSSSNPSSAGTHGSSSQAHGSSSSHGTSASIPSSKSSHSSSSGSLKNLPVTSSLPFPFQTFESPVVFTRRLYDCWRTEVALIVYIVTKNLREELGPETSSDSSSDDSDPVHKAAKTMPNLPSESARLIRFMMGRTGLGSRSRLASSLSHFTMSWLLLFDRHVSFWNSVCQYDIPSTSEDKLASSGISSQSPAKTPALKITVAVPQDIADYGDLDDERLASSTTSGSTFSGGLMPSNSMPHSIPVRLSVTTSAATIRMVLQRPGAKFVELTNHALKSKLIHVRQFAASLVGLCIHHDPLALVGPHALNVSTNTNVPQPLSMSASVSASLDKSSSARGTTMSASSSHGHATAASGGGSSHSTGLANLAARFPPQPWLQLWLSRLGGLAILDGLTHGLPTRSAVSAYGFSDRSNIPTISSRESSNNLVVQTPVSPRGGLGTSSSAGNIVTSNPPGPSGATDRSGTPTMSHDRPAPRHGRRTSISVSNASGLRSGTSMNSGTPPAGSLQSSPVKPKPAALNSRNNNNSIPDSVSRSASGRDLMRNAPRQDVVAKQQQRQRLLLGYQSVPSMSAALWHAVFWKAIGPAVTLFDATTHPMQFIAGKSQLSTSPTWMYPHVPQDQSHSLLDHMTYDSSFINHGSNSPSSSSHVSFGSSSSGSSSGGSQALPISIERPSGIAFVLGASSNPNHVRWSWEGAQGVPSVIPPPLTSQMRAEIAAGNPSSQSSVPLDVLALMHPFAHLDAALLTDLPLLALRDGKLFHRTLGRLFKSDSGPHGALVASTLVMIASSLRRQSLLVPKANGNNALANSGGIGPEENLGGTPAAPGNFSSSSYHQYASGGGSNMAQQHYSSDLPEVALSLDHLIRLLVFVTSPVPTHMHAASSTAQSAFYRETNPPSARDGHLNNLHNSNIHSGQNILSASITTPLNIPIGGERASFFKTRAASIRLLQLIVTTSSMLNWLTNPLLLPVTPGGGGGGNGSASVAGMSTISSVASSAAPSGVNTPTSSKPSTPQASAGAAVSPLSLDNISGFQNPSPSRRGKKDLHGLLSTKDKDKEKDKDKDSALAAGRRGKKGALNSSGHISAAGSSEALSPRSMSSNVASEGSPDSSTASGGAGPGGMIVGRLPPSGASSTAPASAEGSPSNTVSNKGSDAVTIGQLHLKTAPQVYASHPLSSTPSSLENALTPLLSANTSPPVSPRVPYSSGSATPPSSYVSSTPTPFHSTTPLGSSSDSIPAASGRSSLMNSSNAIQNPAAIADASAAVWITMIEGLISVIRFGTDVSSAMAAAEALRNFIFARATVMDVFTKPLSAQVATAFAPLQTNKKDRKGSTVTGSIEELILQARQSGASRGHHNSSLGTTPSFGSSQPSNATTVSNYTTPSSWLVCNSMISSASPSAPLGSTGSSTNLTSSGYQGEKNSGWAVPTLEASLQILLRLHASLSVGQSPTISTSLFTHLVDGLNTTQPLPHIANSLYALNQLLCGPVAPMPPSSGNNSSSSSVFPATLVNAFSGGFGQGSSPQGGSLLGSSLNGGSLLNATLAERQANHNQAIRLQKQLVAQFANPVVFGKIRAIFIRLLDDEFILSIVDKGAHSVPQQLPQPSVYILPHPASIAQQSQHSPSSSHASSSASGSLTSATHLSSSSSNHQSTEDSIAEASSTPTKHHHHSTPSVLKNPASIFTGIFGGSSNKKSKTSSPSSSNVSSSSTKSRSTMQPSASSPSSIATSSSAAQSSNTSSNSSTLQPNLRPPIKSSMILASQAAPGAYLAFMQLVCLCHTMSLNHKIMKAAKAVPEFVDVIHVVSRFATTKPAENSK